MNGRSRYELPVGWAVSYDYHEHPRGISALVHDPRGTVRGVGFAKFNPRDETFRPSTGKAIALGRALKAVTERSRSRRYFVNGSELDLRQVGADIAAELVPTD